MSLLCTISLILTITITEGLQPCNYYEMKHLYQQMINTEGCYETCLYWTDKPHKGCFSPRPEWASKLIYSFDSDKNLQIVEGIIVPLYFKKGLFPRHATKKPITGAPTGGVTGYQNGHLMAASNGGTDFRANFVAQPAEWNEHGSWKKFEEWLYGMALWVMDYTGNLLEPPFYNTNDAAIDPPLIVWAKWEVSSWSNKIPTKYTIKWIIMKPGSKPEDGTTFAITINQPNSPPFVKKIENDESIKYYMKEGKDGKFSGIKDFETLNVYVDKVKNALSVKKKVGPPPPLEMMDVDKKKNPNDNAQEGLFNELQYLDGMEYADDGETINHGLWLVFIVILCICLASSIIIAFGMGFVIGICSKDKLSISIDK
eukprot:284117_1